MATHSSILAWEISWTEEPGGLQPTGSQGVRHDWAATPPPPSLVSAFWLGCAFMCFHVLFYLRFARCFRSVGLWSSFMMENSWPWLLQLLLLLHPLPYFLDFPFTYGPPDIAPQIIHALCFCLVSSHSGVDLEVFQSEASASSDLFFFGISSVSHPISCIFQTWKFYWDLFLHLSSFSSLLMIPSNFLNVWSVFSTAAFSFLSSNSIICTISGSFDWLFF